MHMEHGHDKAGNCFMSGWGHVYQDMPTMRLFAVNLKLYRSKPNILCSPPTAHRAPSPHCVRGASVGSVDSLGR